MDQEGFLLLHIARLKDTRFKSISFSLLPVETGSTLEHQCLTLWDQGGPVSMSSDLGEHILTERGVSQTPREAPRLTRVCENCSSSFLTSGQ